MVAHNFRNAELSITYRYLDLDRVLFCFG